MRKSWHSGPYSREHKVRPRRKGKSQGRHSETEDRRDKEAKRFRHEEPEAGP